MLRFGHQHRKANADADKIDRVRAEERKRKGLPTEFYCKCLCWPDRGAFFSLPFGEMGLGSGICHSCKLKETNNKKERIEVNPSMVSFVSKGTEYCLDDFIYISPTHFSAARLEGERFKSGRNVGLKAFIICQLLKIIVPEEAKLAEISSTQINVRRFFKPEDISPEKAYSSDIREIYYSKETHTIPVVAIEGKCEVKKKNDLPCQQDCPAILDHIFFCEHLYDPAGGSLKQLPAHIKLKYSSGKLEDDNALRKKKGKSSEGENDSGVKTRHEASQGKPLVTLDIFAGCGGLSEGLQLSGTLHFLHFITS